jgi:hypothetical protein
MGLTVRRILAIVVLGQGATLTPPCAAQTTTQPVSPVGSLPELLTAEARQMIADYPNTRYTHKTHIDKSQGVCEVDCSGFLVTILRHKSSQHLASISTKHKRPLAVDFYTAFAAKAGAPARGWRSVENLGDAQAGDVLAWMKEDRVPGDNTGHVMLIANKPILESPGRFQVTVYDSTAHGHAQDNRTTTGRSGIGQGTLWIDADDRGRPIGYRWKARTGLLHTAPIAIGRPVPIE